MLVKFHKCGNILIIDFYKTFHKFFYIDFLFTIKDI